MRRFECLSTDHTACHMSVATCVRKMFCGHKLCKNGTNLCHQSFSTNQRQKKKIGNAQWHIKWQQRYHLQRSCIYFAFEWHPLLFCFIFCSHTIMFYMVRLDIIIITWVQIQHNLPKRTDTDRQTRSDNFDSKSWTCAFEPELEFEWTLE